MSRILIIRDMNDATPTAVCCCVSEGEDKENNSGLAWRLLM